MRQFFQTSLFPLLLCLNVIVSYGQSDGVASKELNWYSGDLTDKSNSKKIVSPHRLVTHGKTSIDLHRGSEQTLTFKILSVTGLWNDEKSDGTLVYNVQYSKDALGKITLERKGSAITAWVDFTQGNKNGMNVEFIVQNVE